MKILICASSRDLRQVYIDAAIELGQGIGRAGHDVIYGGGNQGLMAVCAGAAASAGSKIQGIIPDVFNKASPEVPHPDVTTELVQNLFARKERMLFDADMVVVLPGGIGTLDELWEAAAANDIESYINEEGLLKPVIVLDIENFFEGTKLQIQKCVDEKCITDTKLRMFQFTDTAASALDAIAQYTNNPKPRLSSLMTK